jgi:hypothetical protein
VHGSAVRQFNSNLRGNWGGGARGQTTGDSGQILSGHLRLVERAKDARHHFTDGSRVAAGDEGLHERIEKEWISS